ncbi:glycosyltransferase [Prevotella sp. PINT]|jgi:Glycosyltransferases, probably involved in cell wall biogenesis|uniref:glycosyltransferase n=1 Tax=Palleniella intestinalis TaxID=2736291 RepID=UPI00155223F2|nr:glycosyltransferase [Palleniella intestinalis]NPD82862.1 glycosyltransferase [Palleniella intestinalis]
MKYSVIVPVYNRPDEVEELLASLARQSMKDFEVIIVEDGSAVPCEDVCRKYAGRLDIHYYSKKNSGPGQSRNYGADRASGAFLLILDSDVVLPDGYMEAVDNELYGGACGASSVRQSPSCDAFGGPDAAHESFTPTQKAISYSMTSFFTTGGIRGGKTKLDKFFPRSFNMGIRREVYQKLGGFSKMRFGEDIDFSYRIVEAGYKTRLFPTAWVWHKRRTDYRKFWRQVYNSGIARINLEKRHPGTMKLVHMLPMVFTVGVVMLLCISFTGRMLMVYGPGPDPLHRWYWLCAAPLIPLLLYSLLIAVDAGVRYKSVGVGVRSIAAAFVQLMGYGCGFLYAWWQRCVLGKDEFHAFDKTFYK